MSSSCTVWVILKHFRNILFMQCEILDDFLLLSVDFPYPDRFLHKLATEVLSTIEISGAIDSQDLQQPSYKSVYEQLYRPKDN